jgi:CRP-like cAMP-binding protein
VPVEAALEFIKDNPDVMLDLLSRLYRGMDGLMGRVVHLMSGTAKSRLVYELIIECRRFGNKNADGSYTLKANESDFAAHTGLSRETVSREISKLKERDMIHFEGKEMVVTDISALEALLGSEI